MAADEDGLSDDRLQDARWYRRRRGWLIAGTASIVVLAAVWTERRPIAAELINRRLASWGVPAQYHIADLGLGEQRLVNVVIGDPAHPDLVADWVAVETRWGWNGASILGVRAGHVRVRGRLVNGTLSLGAIDRMLPTTAGAGEPFKLPAIDLAVDDARMRLETPQGIVGLKLTGRGRLNDGFRGSMGAVAEVIDAGACHADRLAAVLSVSVSEGQPRIEGPVRAGTIDCGAVHTYGAVIDQRTTLGNALDRWQGDARVMLAGLRHPQARLEGLAGQIAYAGSAARTEGKAVMTAATLASASGDARRVQINGDYRIGTAGAAFLGGVEGRVALSERWRREVRRLGTAAAGSPVDPLARRMAGAMDRAASDLAFSTEVNLAAGAKGGTVTLNRLEARARSGAVVTLNGGAGVTVNWSSGDAGSVMPASAQIGGLLALSGGDLPDLALRVRAGGDGRLTGTGLMRPYAAGDARLALESIDIAGGPGGAVRFAAKAVLSGPLADGRVDGARLPIAGDWNGHRLAINPACAPVAADRLRVASLDLERPQLTLCPDGGALIALTPGGAVSGGGHADNVALRGTLGGAPLSLSVARAQFALGDQHFHLAGVSTRLGEASDPTRLEIAALDGRIAGGAARGSFSDGAGQITHVPLLLGKARGNWAFAGGKLTLDSGAMTVADAAAAPRFNPVEARGVELALAAGRITATGTLVHVGTGDKAAVTALGDVRIVHDLGNQAGHADLTVPGVTFDPALQPDQLTPLTYGVIADVKGTVSGEGHIRWTRDAVTSDGVFGTAGTDLAAAFGPVQGLETQVHFTDLLGMVSAPNQVATVASINPGVAVEHGVVRYALLPDQKVDVAGAEWPFASGRLTLDPTVLDFAEHKERRMTFRLAGVDAGQFLQQFDFKNLSATGTFDGTLPMIFNEKGGRIEGGQLTVREAGGNIAYVGELSQKDLGLWGNMAFQSLKSINYRSLTIAMNGPLDGEMITDVRFEGVSQGRGAKRNFLIDQLARLPIIFNIRIAAPFRQLFGSVHDIYDPRDLIRRNIAAGQIDIGAPSPAGAAGAQPVQPPESEKRP